MALTVKTETSCTLLPQVARTIIHPQDQVAVFTNTADADSIGHPPTPDPNPGNNTDSAFVTTPAE